MKIFLTCTVIAIATTLVATLACASDGGRTFAFPSNIAPLTLDHNA